MSPESARPESSAADPLAPFKAAQRDGWSHFGPLALFTTPSAARLVRFAAVGAGDRVLDVGCGTGVAAITAARLGAEVSGADLTPALLEQARESAEIAGVSLDWREADVESLPFADAQFDVVISQFGHMFAPRPEVAVAEMLRVLKPGGTIAFSTWPPDQFVGQLFMLTARYAPPPPPGVAPPTLWGEPSVIRERLGTAVRDLRFERDLMLFNALSPQHVRHFTERTAGPILKLVQALEPSDPAKLAQFRREFEALASPYFEMNALRQSYLMTRATKT
jgi:SAM-dependent methyltransferase